MFSRFRGGVAGEGAPPQSSPPSSPRRKPPLSPTATVHQNQPSNSQPQRGGLLSPLFFSNNNATNASSSPHPPPPPLSHENQNQQQSQSFFGGLFSSNATSPPPHSTEASPRSIRASASALLKMATPPPPLQTSSSSISNSNSTNLNANNTSRRPNSSPRAGAAHIDEDFEVRDTLESQLQHRESHIAKLTTDLHKIQSYTTQYQRDIHTLRRQQLESSFRHRVSAKLWRRTNEGLAARCACYQKELTSEAAREIANLIRDAAPPNKDSTYLMMLQDQLNKATLKLSHLSNQTEIILSKGEEVIESLRTEMNEVIRERCKMELELLDSINGLEEDMKRMVTRTERRLKRVQGEIDYLEKNAIEVLKSKEVDDGDEEDEDDEDENEFEENDDDDVVVVEEEEVGEAERSLDDNNGNRGDALDGELKSDEGEGLIAEEENVAGDEHKVSPNKTEDDEDGEPSKMGVNEKQEQQQPRKGGEQQQLQHTPEYLRQELRKLATDRDATLSILQKKLREKNEEFQTLLKSKKSREQTIDKLESVRRDRDEWERSREDGIPMI